MMLNSEEEEESYHLSRRVYRKNGFIEEINQSNKQIYQSWIERMISFEQVRYY